MEAISITELSRRTGLASSALRFYEQRGLLAPVGRAGGKRQYDERAVEQIALIDLLKIAGFTLGEIAGLVDADGTIAPDWRRRMFDKHEEIGRHLVDLERARALLRHTAECPHPSLHECPVHQQVVAAHAATLTA